VVIATARAAGLDVVGVFDDRQDLWTSHVIGCPVVGPTLAAAECECDGAVVAVGDNADRKALSERLDMRWITLVHPAAWVSDGSSLGPGSVVFSHGVVQPDTRIGDHVIINTSASVDHDCVIGSFVHLAPGTRLGGEVHVGEGSLVGIGTSVAPGVLIGEWSVVGAGSAVISDVLARATVGGVPARTLR
jgi:sugar O-acyltransferase (sialic acid O-acetyltransferase NeuD family)